MTDNVTLNRGCNCECCLSLQIDFFFTSSVLILCFLFIFYVFRTKVPYGTYGQHPHTGNILRLKLEGALGLMATFFVNLEKSFLPPLTNAPFLILCISVRLITAVLFKLWDLCQISSAEDLAAFLSVSLSREDTFMLSLWGGRCCWNQLSVVQCQILKMSDLFVHVMV